MYANDASGAWVATELDSGARGRASVVVDAADTVHVVYGTLTSLKHAFRTVGGPWEFEVIGRGTKPAALADAGGLHVAYDTEPGIAYARLAAGSWRTETVADHGSDPALAIAPDGTVHVAWGNQNDAAAPGVMHARRLASGFAVETLHIVYTYFRYPDVTLVDHLTNGVLAPDGVDEDCNGHDG